MNTIYKCFPDGKFKVLTMSYDDGTEDDKKLISIFNHYNIKGTFHINSGLSNFNRIPIEQIKEVYEGHEVATHSFTHPYISSCPIEYVIQEILEDRKKLESMVGYTVRGFSYPYGSYNEEIKKILPYLGIEYSRIVGNSENFKMPNDLYEWQATCHHNYKLQELGQNFVSLTSNMNLCIMYVWGHSFEFNHQDNWHIIENFCNLVSNKNDIWYATNIQIVDYLKVLNNLKFSADGTFVYNPSVQSAWLSVNGKILEVKGSEQINF